MTTEQHREYNRIYRINNVEKIKEYRKRYYNKNKESLKIYGKISRQKHKVRRRGYSIKKYGISSEQYAELLSKQSGKCAICYNPPKRRNLDIDHDHATGKVRGLLCNECNRGIGLLLDSVTILKSAINYLNG